MAQAARQSYGYYEYDAVPSRYVQPERKTRPDIRVIPGRRSENPALQGVSPEFVQAFKMALIIVCALAILCVARIWLSANTVAVLDNAKSIEATLASAQATTNELEIQHSILSSSSRIEQEAANLGMVAPDGVKYLKVPVLGKVITYNDGSISLSGTIRNIEEYAALTRA